MFGEPQLNWGSDGRAASHHIVAGKKEERVLGLCNVPFTGSFDWEGTLMPSHLTHNQGCLSQETGFSWQSLLCLLGTYVPLTPMGLLLSAPCPGHPWGISRVGIC